MTRRLLTSVPFALVAGLVLAGPIAAGARGPESDKEPKKAPSESAPKSKRPRAGDVAPAWTMKDASDKEVTLASLRGKIVVMDFWATWCPPCKASMPKIQALHEKYKDQGVEVLGVDVFERGDPKKGIDYMKSKNFTYRWLGGTDEIAGQYGVNAIPAVFVVGPDGKVIYENEGNTPKNDAALSEAIAKAVEQAKKSSPGG